MPITSHPLVTTGRRLLASIRDDDVSGLAAEMAYRLLLAMFPFFIFVAALGGIVSWLANIDNPTGRIMNHLETALPSDASSVLREQLDEVLSNQSAGLLSVGFGGAIWAASSAMNTFIKAVNRTHGTKEGRPFWRRYMVSLALTLFAGTFLTVAFALLFIGQIYAAEIGDELGYGDATRTVIYWGRLVVVGLLALIVTDVAYWAAPAKKLPFRLVTPGAVLFVASWIVITLGFSVYVANFSSYNETYGTLGGVVILMIWLYLSSFAMLTGAELNHILYAQEPVPAPEEAGRQPRRRSLWGIALTVGWAALLGFVIWLAGVARRRR